MPTSSRGATPRAAAEIGMGYMGYFKVGNDVYPVTNGNFQLKTSVQYYDHVIGLQDNHFNQFDDAKGDGGTADNQIQHRLYRFSPMTPTLTLSGVVVESGIKAMLDAALKFTKFSKVEVSYKAETASELTDAYISSFGLEVSAGDVLNFNAELISMDVKDGTYNKNAYLTCNKIITWDQVQLTSTSVDPKLISSFSLQIDNSPVVIFSAGTDSLMPYEIRPGMQSISGNIGCYVPDGAKAALDPESIGLKIASDNRTFKIVYEPSGANVTPGPFINTIPFKGASKTGQVWS